VLREVVFLPHLHWLAWDRDQEWSQRVVAYKGYDLNTGPGLALADLLRLPYAAPAPDLAPTFSPLSVRERPAMYRSVAERVGQGTFRARLMVAYEGQCAVTGERALPVLEAAHIQEYMGPASNHPQNGLLLRADLHRLFDRGYVTITSELRFEVSSRLTSEFENGKIYYALAGSPIRVPKNAEARPSLAALRWHAEHVFR
jgi:putative restriction endonuclease